MTKFIHARLGVKHFLMIFRQIVAVNWLRMTYSSVMKYEYCRKAFMSTLVLMQACMVSQNDAVYEEEISLFLSSPLATPLCPHVFTCLRKSKSSDRIWTFQLGVYRVPRTFEPISAKESLVKWCSALRSDCCVRCVLTAIRKKYIIRKINTGIRYDPVYHPARQRGNISLYFRFSLFFIL